MPTRREIVFLCLSWLLFGGLVAFSCARDADALCDFSPMVTVTPIKP